MRRAESHPKAVATRMPRPGAGADAESAARATATMTPKKLTIGGFIL
jgi:hypothetical protein